MKRPLMKFPWEFATHTHPQLVFAISIEGRSVLISAWIFLAFSVQQFNDASDQFELLSFITHMISTKSFRFQKKKSPISFHLLVLYIKRQI